MKNKRNTWLRRAAAFVLCAALVLMTGIFPTRVQAKSLEDLKQEYNELEKEIEANKKKLQEIRGNVKGISGAGGKTLQLILAICSAT